VVVLLNWAVAYWSYQRSARIIFGDDREDRRVMAATKAADPDARSPQ
jgi:NADH dehydrogenase